MFFIGILLLTISIIGKGQNKNLKIDFVYSKQSNSLYLNLYDSGSKEILIMNQE